MKKLSSGILTLLVFLSCGRPPLDLEVSGNRDVVVYRDNWGVPHIYGKTDGDAAFGLAYANAEDDYETILFSLLAARGQLAEVYGKEYAPNDYLVQLMKFQSLVDEKYDTDLSPETRQLCENYAAGMNYYIKTNQIKVPSNVLPIRGRDLIAGFVHKLPFFFGIHKVIQQIMEGTYPEESKMYSTFPEIYGESFGSNVFAVAPTRSTDGHTRLMSNTHQPWEGPTAWYEAHIHSEEGWNTVGGLFPGSPVVLVGHNENLGWSHTVNMPDLIDVFELEMNPENDRQYKFDGRWHDLKPMTISFKVKLLKFFKIPVKRTAYWSEYGPVIENESGKKFSIRYAGYNDIRALEQWYRMNKAQDFDQWQDAMQMTSIPMFNTGYADKDGNIFYVYNARLPQREPGYEWNGIVPGNTTETLWQDYLTFSELPQVYNPKSGFIQNCNSSPYETTVGDENPSEEHYPENLGIETVMTNRALRAMELFGSDDQISNQEFESFKYDMKYSEKSNFAKLIKRSTEIVTDNPLVNQALNLLRNWNLETSRNNPHTAFAVYSLFRYIENDPYSVDLNEFRDHVAKTASEFMDWFGKLEVPWGDVNRLIRGSVELPIGGGPDIIRAVYGRPEGDGSHLKAVAGDCYVIYADWDKNGIVSSKSIHQFGATQNEHSPHFADQAYLFVNQKMKPVYFTLDDILANLENSYIPGR